MQPEIRYVHVPELGRRMIPIRLVVMVYLPTVIYILIRSVEATRENVVIFVVFIGMLCLLLFK